MLVLHKYFTKNAKQNLWLIHGYGDSATVFQDILNTTISNECNIIIIDLPGFGSAPLVSMDYKEFLKSLVTEIIVFTPILPHVILGHSMGGAIAVEIASQLNNVAKLFIIDSGLYEDKNRVTGDVLTFNDPEKFKQSLLNKLKTSINLQQDIKFFISQIETSNAEALYYWAKEGIELRANDKIIDRYRKLVCPIYYLIGEKSFTIENHKKTIELCKNSLIWIPDAGHWPMLNAPYIFWKLVEKLMLQ